MKTVSALYENFDIAQQAVNDLVNEGFRRDNISLIVNDRAGTYRDRFDRPQDDVTGGEGAGFGAVVGALVGLGAMVIPGIGPVIAAGPLVAGLLGAGVGAAAGAVTGGITASLIDSGIDETNAHYYAEGVRRGGSLVTVHVEDARANEALSIMRDHHPVDLDTHTAAWRKEGWKGFDPDAPAYTEDEYRDLTR
jgi:uncharacterized membrane protein